MISRAHVVVIEIVVLLILIHMLVLLILEVLSEVFFLVIFLDDVLLVLNDAADLLVDGIFLTLAALASGG